MPHGRLLGERRVLSLDVLLLAVLFTVWLCGMYLQASSDGTGGSWTGFFLQLLTAYYSFAVVHDAAHYAASSSFVLNWCMGFFTTLVMIFPGSWDFWRAFHQHHHKYTNDRMKDPDYFAGSGHSRSNDIDLHVPGLVRGFYLSHVSYPLDYVLAMSGSPPGALGRRPWPEQAVFVAHVIFVVSSVALAVHFGVFRQFLWWYALPGSIAAGVLTYLFAVLPHEGRTSTPLTNRLGTTFNLRLPKAAAALQPLLDAAMQYQTYHGTHHALPSAPFHRYTEAHRLLVAVHGADCIENKIVLSL